MTGWDWRLWLAAAAFIGGWALALWMWMGLPMGLVGAVIVVVVTLGGATFAVPPSLRHGRERGR